MNCPFKAVDVIGVSLTSPNYYSTVYCLSGKRLFLNKHKSQHKDSSPWPGFEPGTDAVPLIRRQAR